MCQKTRGVRFVLNESCRADDPAEETTERGCMEALAAARRDDKDSPTPGRGESRRLRTRYDAAYSGYVCERSGSVVCVLFEKRVLF